MPFALSHQMIDMRKALFAICPGLKLVTDILTPRIRKSPAQDTYNDVESFPLDIWGLATKNGCLYKAMDGQSGILCIPVHETGP